MIISLINNPNDTFPRIPYIVAKMSRGVTPEQCRDDSLEKQIELLLKILSWGHLSVFEHTLFSFHLSGVSRICLDQLNRYRHASMCMESGRVVDLGEREIVMPESLMTSSHKEEIEQLLATTRNVYDQLKLEGLPREDLRFLIPMGISTQEIFSLNLRELFVVRSQRLCSQAQWEIRELVGLMSQRLIEATPSLTPFLDCMGAPCQTCKTKCKKE